MPEVCVVVPCFNEERRLPGRAILSFLHDHPNTAVCFVDDGSSDGTLRVVEGLRRQIPGAVQVVHLDRNQGKAEAVRQGVLHAARSHDFPLIGFWDADLSTPLDELPSLLHTLERDPACELAMGARVRRLGSAIHRSPARHYLGRLFSTAASLLLRLPVYDSQCGAKVMRAEIAGAVFAERFLTKWTFDVEILARLRNLLGSQRVLTAVIEVPLRTWTEVGGSKLRLSHMAKIPFELVKISRRYNAPVVAASTAQAWGPPSGGPEIGPEISVRVLATGPIDPLGAPGAHVPADEQVESVLIPGPSTRVS